MILSSADVAVIHTSSQAPASSVNVFYFSGYVLSTLGNGEFKPASENWQLVVVFFSFSGFIFITTGISYLLNLASAVIHKRSLALSISNLGGSPEEIVANTYQGNGSYDSLMNRVPDLQEKINKHNQNHFAYPISHYFYSTSKTESLAISLSNLDEALTIILYYTERSISVEKEISIIRNAIHEFLETIQHSFITELEEHEDVSPNITDLKRKGIPITSHRTANQISVLKKRRSLIAGFLKSSGWSWNDIYRDEA